MKILLCLFLFSTMAVACPHIVSVGGGVLDPSEPKVAFQIEYKARIPPTCFRPQIGLLTCEFNSLYIYGGLALDLFIIKNTFVITPSFSPGLYFHGNSFDLGSVIEFRSGVELALVLYKGARLGGQFFHISNGHISERNPGVNGIILFLSLPVKPLFCIPTIWK